MITSDDQLQKFFRDGEDHRPEPNNTKILIGEVSMINSTVLKKILEKLGYDNIVQVDNGEHAVAAAKREFFNVIFLDFRMPVIGGLEASILIREYENEKKRTPAAIVGVTAVTEEDIDGQQCGMDVILNLPLHVSKLKNVLDKYGQPKEVDSLKNLVKMFITNRPQLFQYYTQLPYSVLYKNEERFVPSELVDELHEMKESSPTLYKYPNFDGLDTSEILVIISDDYHVLRYGVAYAIEAKDIAAVHRNARSLAAILKHISDDGEIAAAEMSKCLDCDQAQQYLETLDLYMEHVWQ